MRREYVLAVLLVCLGASGANLRSEQSDRDLVFTASGFQYSTW